MKLFDKGQKIVSKVKYPNGDIEITRANGQKVSFVKVRPDGKRERDGE